MSRIFIPKLKFLQFIEDEEIVGPQAIADKFGISYHAAAVRLWRYQKKGLVEPLVTQYGKWILSPKGDKHLNVLRQLQEVEKK